VVGGITSPSLLSTRWNTAAKPAGVVRAVSSISLPQAVGCRLLMVRVEGAARESSWREGNRRLSNGEQVSRLAWLRSCAHRQLSSRRCAQSCHSPDFGHCAILGLEKRGTPRPPGAAALLGPGSLIPRMAGVGASYSETWWADVRSLLAFAP
jgi:hypothetical protein